jgi:hypothetical protein
MLCHAVLTVPCAVPCCAAFVLQTMHSVRMSHDQFKKLFRKWQNGLQKGLLVSYVGCLVCCFLSRCRLVCAVQ